MFPVLILAFTAISSVAASTLNSVTWLRDKQSAIAKLETPGYPVWLMDKANAPMMYLQAEEYYWKEPSWKRSAIALNFTMSHDNKTLYLNHQPILPFAGSDTPPAIGAYQVPANYSNGQIRGLADMGLFRGYWEGLTLGWRYLTLDYDRVVTSDPEATRWYAHQPTLVFRVMGLGAHSRSDVLEVERQKAIHVTLKDESFTSSDDPNRSYDIINIEFKDIDDSYSSYGRVPPTEDVESATKCSLWSWKCPDKDVYFYELGAPAYRFIWRSRFDQHGRIGSLRHAVYKKWAALLAVLENAGPSMLLSFAILFSSSMAVLAGVMGWKRFSKTRNRRLREAVGLDDSLLGEGAAQDALEKFVDVETDDEDEGAPPLPPRLVRPEATPALVDVETV
ncbi:hypothetical protein K491DRAFT_680186 [Lophiostoma macrostomum CBS 122681]|uniref:Uncharacterized protein n=1 Tax=Lophiostoma macrostomum CBS 122681 TaxID=1314788 RepID=A0A6A6T4U4_9PLEO|nr:hypothetical protein K491DRAFT_680186 [Lophiostoma macrostomum CBS 122681]